MVSLSGTSFDAPKAKNSSGDAPNVASALFQNMENTQNDPIKLTLNVDPSDLPVTLTGAGNYATGEVAYVSTDPVGPFKHGDEYYKFANWTHDTSTISYEHAFEYTVNPPYGEDITLVANYSVVTDCVVELKAEPSTISPTLTGAGTYAKGTYFNISTTEVTNYQFLGWYEEGVEEPFSPSLETTISSIQSHKTFIAKYKSALPEYTVTLTSEPSDIGVTLTGGGTFQQGASTTIEASDATKYSFLGWFENGTQITTSKMYYVESLSSNRSFIAKYEAKPTHQLSLTQDPSEAGATFTGAGYYCEGEEAKIEITFDITKPYRFLGWYKGDEYISNKTTTIYTMPNEAVTLTAKFEKLNFIGAAIGGFCTVDGTPHQLVAFGFMYLDVEEQYDNIVSFGVEVYTSPESTEYLYRFTSEDKASLKTNEGRLYAVIGAGDSTRTISDDTWYFAKAFVEISTGILSTKTVWSEYARGKGDPHNEYKLK